MVDTLTPSPREREPGWAEAFAALPIEAPPRDGWRRLERKLDAAWPGSRAARRERRTNWTIGLASAAVLAVVAWSPLLRWAQGPGTGAGDTAGPTVAANAGEPRAINRSATDQAGEEPRAGTPVATAPDVPDPRVAERRVASESATRPAAPARSAGTEDINTATAGEPRRSGTPDTRVAAGPGTVDAAIAAASSKAADSSTASTRDASPEVGDLKEATSIAVVPDTNPDAIRRLQAQSAQLEALVALARDDSAGSATLAIAGGELDASIAAIDASLTEPDLSSEQRTGLWQQRIDALQQLARLESAERWLASQGALYDTALVSID